MFTKEDAINMITRHNNQVNTFINEELPKALGIEDPDHAAINIDQWFKAQALIQKQGFYKQGMAIVKVLRADGYDVKIDGQRETLHYYGEL